LDFKGEKVPAAQKWVVLAGEDSVVCNERWWWYGEFLEFIGEKVPKEYEIGGANMSYLKIDVWIITVYDKLMEGKLCKASTSTSEPII
jgi:hypothetical protein